MSTTATAPSLTQSIRARKRKPVVTFQLNRGESFEAWRARHFRRCQDDWMDGTGKLFTDEHLRSIFWFRNQNDKGR